MLRLNVGGKEFVTSKATLTKFDGYFKNLPEIQEMNPTSVAPGSQILRIGEINERL